MANEILTEYNIRIGLLVKLLSDGKHYVIHKIIGKEFDIVRNGLSHGRWFRHHKFEITPRVEANFDNWVIGRTIICKEAGHTRYNQIATIAKGNNDGKLYMEWDKDNFIPNPSNWKHYFSFDVLDILPVAAPIVIKSPPEFHGSDVYQDAGRVIPPAEKPIDWDAYNGIKKYPKKY